MPNRIIYNWGDGHLQVLLGKRTEPRIKALFWGEFLFTTGMATIFLLQALPISSNIMHVLACLGAALLYALASYRFISRMFFAEELWLDAEYLTLVHSTPFKRKINRYEWVNVGPLHYTGKASKTDHPLKGNCYDYFGFETQERLVQDLHQEGNLYFNYAGFSVRFARNVYSWDAEEMVRMMKIYAGNQLRLGPEWKRMTQESWHSYEDDI